MNNAMLGRQSIKTGPQYLRVVITSVWEVSYRDRSLPPLTTDDQSERRVLPQTDQSDDYGNNKLVDIEVDATEKGRANMDVCPL